MHDIGLFLPQGEHPQNTALRPQSDYFWSSPQEWQANIQSDSVTIERFMNRQFGGNPLAVVVDGTELSTPQMQAIATEFNLAETTFVLPPERPENTAKVRIFTPRAELPFAGHPNIGTAFVLGQRGECHGRPI